MNKLLGLFLLALAFLAPVSAEAACSGGTCFWIGSTGRLCPSLAQPTSALSYLAGLIELQVHQHLLSRY